MKLTKKNEEAVSPVIGVILMVAVTVILAAIIGAFVFGMVGQMQTSKIVVVTAMHKGTSIYLTNSGGQDITKVMSFNATYNGSIINPPSIVVGNTNSTVVVGTNQILTVVANFDDGGQQVILNTNI